MAVFTAQASAGIRITVVKLKTNVVVSNAFTELPPRVISVQYTKANGYWAYDAILCDSLIPLKHHGLSLSVRSEITIHGQRVTVTDKDTLPDTDTASF